MTAKKRKVDGEILMVGYELYNLKNAECWPTRELMAIDKREDILY